MSMPLLIVLLGTLALNAFATTIVWRSAAYATAQKRLQVSIIWILPVIGAGLVLSFYSTDRRQASNTKDSDTWHEMNVSDD